MDQRGVMKQSGKAVNAQKNAGAATGSTHTKSNTLQVPLRPATDGRKATISPASAPKSLAQGNTATHQGASVKRPTVAPAVGQGGLKPAPPNNPTPTRSGVNPAPHKSQAVNQSGGRPAEGVTKEYEISLEDMMDDIGLLDEKLEDYTGDAIDGPVRLILIGEAYAKVTGVKLTKKPSALDVLLDLQCSEAHTLQVRKFMRQIGDFKECTRPGVDARQLSRELFSSMRAPAKKDRKLVRLSRDVSHLDHVEVYVMDTARAFDFELRRWADQGGDGRARQVIVDIAESIWRKKPEIRGELWGCGGLQQLIRARAAARGNEDPVDKFLAFCKSTKPA